MKSITTRAASVLVATSIGTAALTGTSTAADADNRVAGYHEAKIECMEAGALGRLEKEWSAYQCVKVDNDRWALIVGQAQPAADREHGYHETGGQGEGNGGRLLAGALPYTGG